ncbi:MAG: DUF6485 family protein [bacterium]
MEDIMECSLEKNKRGCSCTSYSCSRYGKCCECVNYHKSRRELPGCFFTAEAEKTWDRSFEKFVECVSK